MSCGRDSAETSDFRLAPLNILDGWEIFGRPIFHSPRSMVVLRQCRNSGHDSADSEIAQKTGQAAVEGTHDNP